MGEQASTLTGVRSSDAEAWLMDDSERGVE